MTVEPDGSIHHTWASPTGENLVARYSKIQITLEPVPDSDPSRPSGTVVYEDSIPLQAMNYVRRLLINGPLPTQKGILTNLQSQLALALQHARAGADSNDLAVVKSEAEYVINTIEGRYGRNYKDHDGDGTVEGSADTTGILTYAANRKYAQLAVMTAPDEEGIADGAALVDMYGANAKEWATEARDTAFYVLQSGQALYARIWLGNVTRLLEAALYGFDSDGDGVAEAGGAKSAYEAAQQMAGYHLELYSGPAAAVSSSPARPVCSIPLPHLCS
jgi:hypothetical protein